MGWIRDGAYDHEGWVADVLADGREAGGSTAGGVIVHELLTADVEAGREVRSFPGSDHIDVVVPWDQVMTWRLRCQCGWTGLERPAITETKYGTRDCPEELEDRVFAPAWDAHVAPFTALHDLEELIEEQAALEEKIAVTVTLAHDGGASWQQIGRAARLSKQGAQQKWGSVAVTST